MRRFAPRFGALLLETGELAVRILERAQSRFGVRALHMRILRHALAQPAHQEVADQAPCGRHDGGIELRTLRRITLQLVGKARVEPHPLAHDFLLVVALLPALQPVALGVRRPVVRRRQLVLDGCRVEPPMQRVEHVGNVVVELRARQRIGSGYLGIPLRSAAPRFEDLGASLLQMGSECTKLTRNRVVRGHGSVWIRFRGRQQAKRQSRGTNFNDTRSAVACCSLQ